MKIVFVSSWRQRCAMAAALSLFGGLLAPFEPARAATVAEAQSPDGSLKVSVVVEDEGKLSYRVDRKGVALIGDSRLGMLLGSGRLERNLAFVSKSTSPHDDTWEQPWGERQFVRNRYNELRVAIGETLGAKRRFDVVFRLYEDGLGFRYEFPEQGPEPVVIEEELTEFNLAHEGTAWWIPAGEWNREEYLYRRTPIEAIGFAQTPVTAKLADGTHVSIHEAALVDYSGMNLVRVDGRRLKSVLTPGEGVGKVVRLAPFHTPWRTLQVADDAGGLAMSSLILNLNEPNKLGDVSWFKPMKYAGVWWEMHLDSKTWSSGPRHGATDENVIRHIDFAAKNGFKGVLVEGWNLGWDGHWFGDGGEFDFSRSYPDFDLPKLSAYAKSKGVQLIGHHETAGNVARYESQLEAALALYQRMGVNAVKTGYVADAGDIQLRGADGKLRRAWHEGQDMARHHLKVVSEAARHRIAINAHEPIKSTGLRRTYPNWISNEGARGMEYNAWGKPPNPPEHEANLVFTRLLAGPMDFTPGILSLTGAKGMPIQSTLAKQLALYVVLYSPIQMVPDLPEHYERYPEAFQFIKDVAVDWSDTRVLNGEVGDYATVARKQRGGDDWFLGSISDENARTLKVPLDFLDAGKTYRAEIYRDGADADWKGERFSFARESRDVRRGEVLSIRLAPGGGQAIRFTPAGGR
ncbi:glycoside hydrolase family 97 protein [Lysobacter sp. ESA13C]|uniref:glycoside hydrolase family 97 protein n=1 Tax=Lysobacter sp. ESA13C TaxID=2862676 RepID=UPI001CBAECFB|nr:glycoside hydrolase family 97 protein [Lysobacter sp. ESA13C]